MTGADQDGSRVGLVAQQLVPAHALNEVASPAGQTAHLLRVSVKVQTLAGAQADEQMRACSDKDMDMEEDMAAVVMSHNHGAAKKTRLESNYNDDMCVLVLLLDLEKQYRLVSSLLARGK